MIRSSSQRILYPPSERMAGAIGISFAIAGCCVDLVTGTAYSPLIFYVPSVMYAAWFCGLAIGWLCIVLISASTLLVNSLDLNSVLTLQTELFNAATRIATIILVHHIVRNLRRQMQLLRELNSRLQQTDCEKNKLFGVISHDLRSPFNAILAYAELLDRDAHVQAIERTRQYAQSCLMAARNSYELLENLLQWAQLQMNRVELVPTVFEASAVVHRCLETYRAAATLKTIDLRADPVDPAVTCFADFAAAETVLRNITNNAIKFTPSGGRVVLGVQAGEGFVEFTVRDTGVGIPRSRLEKLFALAAAPASSGTQGERGIGLGLMLCKDLVARSNGKISVESDAGVGSCFRIRLPSGSGATAGGAAATSNDADEDSSLRRSKSSIPM